MYLNRYLQENPDLAYIGAASLQEREVLLWANEKGYINLKTAPAGQKCYSQQDLKTAQMWAEKEGYGNES